MPAGPVTRHTDPLPRIASSRPWVSAPNSRCRPTRGALAAHHVSGVCCDVEKSARGHRVGGALDCEQLAVAEFRDALHQPSAGLTQHDTARRRDGLHPLREAHLIADRGVARRADLTGDHLTGVDADSQR